MRRGSFAEVAFLSWQQYADLSPQRACGDGDDVVAADDGVDVQSIGWLGGNSVDRPRAVVVIGATGTRVMYERTGSRVSTRTGRGLSSWAV
jgi:hypothetical protein